MPTQAEFAQHMGVSQQAISKLAQRGVFPKGGTLDEWRHAYVRHLIDLASGHLSEDGALDLTEERALLARAQRLKLEIEMDKLKGKLLDAEEVDIAWREMIMASRARLLALPQRAALAVVAAKTTAEVAEVLRVIVYEALTELAEDPGVYTKPAEAPTSDDQADDHSTELEPAPKRKAPPKARKASKRPAAKKAEPKAGRKQK
jgi:transcriptional regulator with XRE-family HTH domain